MFVPTWVLVVVGAALALILLALWISVSALLRNSAAMHARTFRLENAVQGLIFAHRKKHAHDELIAEQSLNSPGSTSTHSTIKSFEEFTEEFLGPTP